MGNITFLNFPTWAIAKIFVLLALIMYIVFAVVVIRQVKLMIVTLQSRNDKIIRFVSYIQLALCLAVFVFALIIL